jgi:hypothetical protein
VAEIIAFLVLGQNWTFFKGLVVSVFGKRENRDGDARRNLITGIKSLLQALLEIYEIASVKTESFEKREKVDRIPSY